MKAKIQLSIVIFLCLCASVAYAENEFSYEVIEVSSEAEAGSNAEYYINLTNLQLEKDAFRVAYDSLSIAPFSDFAKNIIIEPSQLKLESGQSGLFHVVIKVSDNIKEDRNYESLLIASSLTKPKAEKQITLKTYVVSPEDLILIFPDIPQQVIPGEETQIIIRLKNRANILLKNYEVLVTSDLPQLYKNFVTDFLPKEEIVETLTIKPPKSIPPGDYVVTVKVYDIASKTRGSYSSAFSIPQNENLLEQKEEDSGFLSKKTKITKKNEGNVKTEMIIKSKIGFFSRLFTRAKPEPEVKDGAYIWKQELKPGEEFFIEYTTSYKPIFYGLLIIAIATFTMNFLIDRSVLIRKRIYRIKRTEDGLSELKILIHIKNGRSEEVSNVRIIDVLPNTMGSPEDFGTLKPNIIQKGTKGERFIWEIDKLAPHEERIFSYKVKSKLKLIGETQLPPCMIQYQTKNGKVISERSAALFLEHTPRHE